MRALGFIIFNTLILVSALAENSPVHRAWTRTFPNKALNIIPDHLGNIVVFGTEIDDTGMPTNAARMFLLNSHGRRVASAGRAVGEVAADRGGRVFAVQSGIETPWLRCTAFAPRLDRVLWSHEMSLAHPLGAAPMIRVETIIPDEAGGAFVFGELSRVSARHLFFVAAFDRHNSQVPAFHYISQYDYSRSIQCVVRSPSGTLYAVGSSTALSRYHAPFVLSYSREAGFHSSHRQPGIHSSWWISAAFDTRGNSILVGGFRTNAFYRSASHCIVEKQNAFRGTMWLAVHTNGSAGTVTLDLDDNAIVQCSHGTTKYAPDGRMLWQFPETGANIRVDSQGNIFFVQRSEADGVEFPVLTKLSPDGERVWHTELRFRGRRLGSAIASLMPDDEAGVYVALHHQEGTSVMRLAPKRVPPSPKFME